MKQKFFWCIVVAGLFVASHSSAPTDRKRSIVVRPGQHLLFDISKSFSEEDCGPYFAVTRVQNVSCLVVGFRPDEKIHKFAKWPFWAHLVKVRIDESKLAPTFTLLDASGLFYSDDVNLTGPDQGIMIFLTQEQHAEAEACLPPPDLVYDD